MSRLAQSLLDNRKVILLTFEIFWIVISVLESASATSAGGAMQFVYANF